MLKKFSTIGLAIALSAVTLFAQDAQLRSAVAGQKYKIKGVVVNKIDDTTYIISDSVGVDTKIVVSPSASIKHNGFFGGDKYPVTALVKGLTMEVEGVGDSSGSVMINKVRFEKANLVAAQALDKRVAPVEERVTAAEQNAQRISGQID